MLTSVRVCPERRSLNLVGSGGGRLTQALLKPTVAKAFLGSQQDLNATLLSTTCNFARCIKPNAAMQCGVFDNRWGQRLNAPLSFQHDGT